MEENVKRPILNRCRNCGGLLDENEEGEIICASCSWEDEMQAKWEEEMERGE